MHGVESGEKRRITRRIAFQHQHPTTRQRLGLQRLRFNAAIDQLAHAADQLGPLLIAARVGLIERQLGQFVCGKIFIVHGH
ncbi:hypothetical protein D3C87_1596130 [compost metagenome]